MQQFVEVYTGAMAHYDDPSLAAIEASTLLRRARSVVPKVRERAFESLHEHVQLAAAEGSKECYEIYLRALEDADHVKSR